jgi:hypothetical protein
LQIQKAQYSGGTLAIPALRRLRQEDHEFKASLSNTVRPFLKNLKNEKSSVNSR